MREGQHRSRLERCHGKTEPNPQMPEQRRLTLHNRRMSIIALEIDGTGERRTEDWLDNPEENPVKAIKWGASGD